MLDILTISKYSLLKTQGFNMMNLGKSIKLALVYSNMSAIELAKRTGLSDATVSLMANNHRGASVATINKIAAAFDMKVSELIALGEEAKPSALRSN